MTGAAGSLRIDKALWFLRLAKTRGLAQQWIAAGHIRVNGLRVERSAHPLAVGDVLTIPIGAGVRVIELVALPVRRGPAPEAQACYRTLDAGGEFAIAPPSERAHAPPQGIPRP